MPPRLKLFHMSIRCASAANNPGRLRRLNAASAAHDLADYTAHAWEQMQLLTDRNSLQTPISTRWAIL